MIESIEGLIALLIESDSLFIPHDESVRDAECAEVKQ